MRGRKGEGGREREGGSEGELEEGDRGLCVVARVAGIVWSAAAVASNTAAVVVHLSPPDSTLTATPITLCHTSQQPPH